MPTGDKKGPEIALIAVASLNGVIFANKSFRWRILQHSPNFQRLVQGAPVIMGRKTREENESSILGSRNIVLSTTPKYSAMNAEIAGSIPEALYLLRNAEKIFVVGGASVFSRMIEIADVIHLTEINAVVTGHLCFPTITPKEWQEVARTPRHSRVGDLMNYAFVEYRRRTDAKVQNDTTGPDNQDSATLGERTCSAASAEGH